MTQCQFIRALSAGRPQHIVCYGCSLTAGGEWVKQMEQVLVENYPGLATVTNSGQGAMWSQWGAENLSDRVLAKNPDAVFIEFSMNDAYLPYETSVDAARTNLASMICAIRRHNAETEIIIMIMNPPTGEHLLARPEYGVYNQMYRDVARQHNLLLIDHEPNWNAVLQQSMDAFLRYVPDGIHPAPAGCMTIILPHLLACLGISTARTPEAEAAGADQPAATLISKHRKN